jgi:hypothetical protein
MRASDRIELTNCRSLPAQSFKAIAEATRPAPTAPSRQAMSQPINELPIAIAVS